MKRLALAILSLIFACGMAIAQVPPMVRLAPGTFSISTENAIAASKLWMFSSNGWRAPTQHYVPGVGATSCISEIWRVSDDYWTTAPRFLFANWYLTTSGGGGQEAANGNAISIDSVGIVVGSTATQLTIAGAIPLAMADDTEAWTDAAPAILLPPRTPFAIRTAYTVPTTAAFIASPYPGLQQSGGDKVECGASTLAAKVLAGGIATSVPAGNLQYGYTAIAMVAKGWDGRPVALGFGTSIEQGVGQSRLYPGPFREIGPFGRGMVSMVGGALRWPAVTWAVSGGLAAGISGTGANQGLTRRIRAIAALAQANLPMTFTYSGFGTNDQTGTLASWQGVMTPMWAAIKSSWAVPLIQSTLLDRTTSTDGFITQTNQTATANWVYPTGSAWGLYKWMVQQQGQTIDGVVDVANCNDNYPTGIRGTHRVDVLDAGWSTVTTAAVTAGGTGASLTANARAGEILAFSDNPESLIVNNITGTGPFVAAFNSALVSNHALGATIKQSVSLDGIHPGDVLAQKIAECAYVPAKIRGTFTNSSAGTAGTLN